MFKTVIGNLTDFPLSAIRPLADKREAAVLLALTRETDSRMVFIQRAAHLNDHPGEVAFPGGMWEQADNSLLDTALRESHEEINLPPANVDLIATLPTRETRLGVRVTPFVGLIPADIELQPEPSEIDAVFSVPIRYFLDVGNLGRQKFPLMDSEYLMPCYRFEGYDIWGFTLAVLAEFFNQSLDAGIKLKYPTSLGSPSKPRHLK